MIFLEQEVGFCTLIFNATKGTMLGETEAGVCVRSDEPDAEHSKT